MLFALTPTDDFGFRLFLLLHLIAAVVAFAPGFVWPFISVAYRREGKPVGALNTIAADVTLKVQGTAAVLLGLFGFAMVGMSDKVFEFSQTWVTIAMVLWFLVIGVVYGLLLPAQKKAGTGDEAAEAKLPMYQGLLHILLVLSLIDMIWKPGF